MPFDVQKSLAIIILVRTRWPPTETKSRCKYLCRSRSYSEIRNATTKLCIHCKQVKSVAGFYIDTSTEDGYGCKCLQCIDALIHKVHSRPAYKPRRREAQVRWKRAVNDSSIDASSAEKVKVCYRCMQLKFWSQFPSAPPGVYPLASENCLDCVNAGPTSSDIPSIKPVITVLDHSPPDKDEQEVRDDFHFRLGQRLQSCSGSPAAEMK